MNAAQKNLNPNTRKRSPPTDEGWDPSCLHGPKAAEVRHIGGSIDGRWGKP
jgi:hypothetical protein